VELTKQSTKRDLDHWCSPREQTIQQGTISKLERDESRRLSQSRALTTKPIERKERSELAKRTWVSLDTESLTGLLSDTISIDFGDLNVASRDVGVCELLPNRREVLKGEDEERSASRRHWFVQIPMGNRALLPLAASQYT